MRSGTKEGMMQLKPFLDLDTIMSNIIVIETNNYSSRNNFNKSEHQDLWKNIMDNAEAHGERFYQQLLFWTPTVDEKITNLERYVVGDQDTSLWNKSGKMAFQKYFEMFAVNAPDGEQNPVCTADWEEKAVTVIAPIAEKAHK